MTEIFVSGTEVFSDAKITETPYERRRLDMYVTVTLSMYGQQPMYGQATTSIKITLFNSNHTNIITICHSQTLFITLLNKPTTDVLTSLRSRQ